MPLSASAGGVHGLGDNDDEASLWEVLMVLGVVASRFFCAGRISYPIFSWCRALDGFGSYFEGDPEKF